MKKMKRMADGGSSIDESVRARAMRSVEGLEGIKGADIPDETGTVKGSIKRNEYGDLYDSEMKAPPKPKKKASKSKTNAAIESHSRMNAMGDTYARGGKVSQLSKANGCAIRGKTRGRIV
jgi:hypothetical protein